jgi:ATP-dependent helicase/nuclease subunit A
VSRGDDESLFAFRTNMVVTASAGTGKTFRLVTLYALLTLGLTSKGTDRDDEAAPPVAPSRIAATTFSRAAAAEIRERVQRVLAGVANGSDDAKILPYLQVLEARARRTRSPSIDSPLMRERARAALADLPQALIDTLHGLAGRIVRASALDLGIAASFRVLDEDGARRSVDLATEEVLSATLARGERAPMDLLDAGSGLALTRRRVAELLDRADEEGLAIDELSCADFAEAARGSMARLRDLCDALVADRSRTLAEPAAFAGNAARRWLDAGPGSLSEAELAEAFVPLFERRSTVRPSAAEGAFFAFRESVKGETNAARARRLAAFVAVSPELGPRTHAMKELLAEIAERRAVERRASGALGFGDLLRTARDALRDEPAVAKVARALFDVLLVDEFQDTSGVQRDLVYLLRETAAKGARRTPGTLPAAADLEPSGLLVVGDRKQSIYGFRGADVTVFARVCAELAGREASEALRLGSEFEAPGAPNAAWVALFENRRSDRRILDFVNWFASEDFDGSSGYPFDIWYAESEHLVAADGLAVDGGAGAGGPRVVVVDDRGEESEEFPPLVRGASPPLREALVAAGVVDRAVRDRAFGELRFGDVAILARRRATLPLVEMALARLDIPYVVAGRGLFETREVRDVFAALRLVLDPFDRHALATVLRGPAVGLSDEALLLLSEPGRGLSPPDTWFGARKDATAQVPDDERERLRRFAARFRDLRRIGLGLGPASAIRYAVEKLDLDRVIAALPHAAQHLGNLERLVEIAARRGGTLTEFVRWLDQQIADQTDESEAASLHDAENAVTLTTIHASKGLEFRAVVLVDAGAAVRATPLSLALLPSRSGSAPRLVARHVHERGGSLYTPEATLFAKENLARELAERRRLTYVAMTRAKDHLFLVVPPLAANGSAAATMRRLLPGLDAATGAVVEGPLPSLLRPTRSPAPLAVAPGAERAPEPRSPLARGPLGISTTPLATFEQCPRRYRLVHELSVEPPPFAGPLAREMAPHARDELRALGTAAHRLLERWPLARWGEPAALTEVVARLVAEASSGADSEHAQLVAENIAAFLAGPYAARVRSEGRAVLREERFVLPVESESGVLALRGTIDLFVSWPDGSADILDYKSSWRSEPGSHDFQLHAYALAARRRYGARSVRVAAMNLVRTAAPVFTHLGEAELQAFERRLVDLRASFAHARTSGHFAGIDRPACELLRCGFISACHAL